MPAARMRALAALTRQRVSRSLDPLAVRDGRDLLLRLLKVHVGRNRRGDASHVKEQLTMFHENEATAMKMKPRQDRTMKMKPEDIHS